MGSLTIQTRLGGPSKVPVLAVLLGLWSAGCGDATDPQFQFVHGLQPIPDSAYVEVGEGVEYSVQILDQWGNELPDREERVEWSIQNSAVATLETSDSGASVTAVAPGEATLFASLGRAQGRANVFVPPPGLGRIEIEPSVINVTVGAASVRPRVRFFDAAGSEMDPLGFRVLWSSRDTAVARVSGGSIDWTSAVSGTSEGQTQVRAKVGPRSATADVFVILGPQPMEAPSVVAVSGTSLKVIWHRVPAANEGYRVDRALSSDGPFAEIGSTGSGAVFPYVDTTYVDTELSPGSTYFYAVRACNRDHGCSESGEPASATTPADEGAALGERSDRATPGRQAPGRLDADLGPPVFIFEQGGEPL